MTIYLLIRLADHDRNLEHNWMSDQFQQLLLWDSGLSFVHGPRGRDSCLNLLCGPDLWVERSIELGETRCQKICRFRESTIEKLQDLSFYANSDEEKLGRKLQLAMEEDLIDPVLQYNLYYLYGRQPKIRFPVEDFYEGLDYKVEKLLGHVDSCIQQYGRQRVLIKY